MNLLQELRNDGHRVYTAQNFADLALKRHDTAELGRALQTAIYKINSGKIDWPAGYLISIFHRLSPMVTNGTHTIDRDGKRYFVLNLRTSIARDGQSVKVVHTVPVPQEEVA